MRFSLLGIVLAGVAYGGLQVPTVYDSDRDLPNFLTPLDSVQPVQLITQRDMHKSGALNLAQVLRYAGLQVNTLGGQGSQVTVNFRGFGDNAGQNTLVLLDGQPLTSPDLGGYNFNTIPLAIIQRVEIRSGSAGVQYGDQAVGGVINIITRPIAKQSKTAQLGTGSYDTFEQQLGLSRRFSHRYGWRANLYHLRTDNYREQNKYKNTYLDLAGDKYFHSNHLTMEYQFNHSRLQYPGALTYSQVMANRRQAHNHGDYDQQNNHTLISSYHQRLFDESEGRLNALFVNMDGTGRMTNPFDKHRYEVNLEPSFQTAVMIHNKEILPRVGFQFNQGEYRFESSTYDSNARQMTTSEYAHVTIPATSRMKLVFGARYAQADTHLNTLIASSSQAMDARNDAFVTNVGVSVRLNSAWHAYLRRAGSFRFPKTDEDINTNTGQPLKSETGVSYETGLAWQKRRWSANLDLYRLNLDNEITAIPIPNSKTTFAENQNLPPTQRTGFSLATRYQLFNPLSVEGVYRFVDATFDSGPDKGNRIPFVADNTLTVNMLYQLGQHWTAAVEGDYTGKRNYANDPEQRTKPLASYALLNFNVTYHWRALSVDMKVNNITNTLYYDYAFDMYNGNQTTSYYYPAAGRNYYVYLTVKL